MGAAIQFAANGMRSTGAPPSGHRLQHRRVLAQQLLRGNAVDAGHLAVLRLQVARGPGPHDDRRDDEARTCGIVVEPPEHLGGGQPQADLLLQLAQRSLFGALAVVGAAARQRPLAGMPAQTGGAAREQQRRLVAPACVMRQARHVRAVAGLADRHCDRRAAQPGCVERLHREGREPPRDGGSQGLVGVHGGEHTRRLRGAAPPGRRHATAVAHGIIRAMPITADDLRRHAVARSLFAPTTLPRAIVRLGFVQADPIRAPARAQDLTLRHRVRDYRAGDLERRYPRLAIEEDFFVNYGFLPRATQQLMHPRVFAAPWPAARAAQAAAVLDFVRERGTVHPREVDAQFSHGKARNWFGGSSNASTQLLDAMHYRGLLRIARRDGGVRVYAAREPHPPAGDAAMVLDALIDVIVAKYAPIPMPSLSWLVHRLSAAVPQWEDGRRTALARLRARLPQAVIAGFTWVWPDGENPASKRHHVDDAVRLLAPFDPVVWDRRRFEALWGWAYRFEAYTPAAKRLRGYYALPLLWREQVIGWANLALREGRLVADLGYVAGTPPREPAFRRALADELARIERFLGDAS